ncbi:protein phosphatase 1 regulatory subunit 7-like [Lineus longissimus]|uniref:protein phosphatase 1 regulatory subunit 7-like n=1 Tax=Lineus longissimus TaxID=88925 RepID=UPI00315DD759
MSTDIGSSRKSNIHENVGLQLNDVKTPVRQKMSSGRRHSGGGRQQNEKFEKPPRLLSTSSTTTTSHASVSSAGSMAPNARLSGSSRAKVSSVCGAKPKQQPLPQAQQARQKKTKPYPVAERPSHQAKIKKGCSPLRQTPVVNGDADFYDNDDELDADDGQDVMFYNVPSEREKSEEVDKKRKFKKMTEEMIFDSSQESNCHRVYEIILHAAGIKKIENLQKFTKCRVLDLSCNHIENIEDLEQLQDLRELKLYDNQLRTIQNLDCLKELVHLQLQHNKIKSLGRGIINLRKLSQLRLDHNCIMKLEGKELTSCSQLTALDLSYNRLDSVVALNCLPNLEELQVANNRLKVVGDLSRCRKLQDIDFSGNRLTDLSGLKGLPNLMVLNVSRNHLFNLKSVGKLRSLQELNISYNKVSELSSLVQQFPNLEILNISNNSIEKWEEVDKLKTLTNLVELFASKNPATECAVQQAHQDVRLLLPHLDMLDGCHLKKLTPRSSAPIMRPMSASTIVSSRHVECQLKTFDDEISAFEVDMNRKFESLFSSMSMLPEKSPNRPDSAFSRCLSSSGGSRPSSRRSRIMEAKEFAAQNF